MKRQPPPRRAIGLFLLEGHRPRKKHKTSRDQEACRRFLSFFLPQVPSFLGGGSPSAPLTQAQHRCFSFSIVGKMTAGGRPEREEIGPCGVPGPRNTVLQDAKTPTNSREEEKGPS